MLITLWSVKGGSGVSVVAAGLAALLARGSTDGALLVDLGGDQPALLGIASPGGPGVSDWLAAPHGDRAALRRLEVEAGPSLALLPAGNADRWPPARAGDLVESLGADRRAVVVDGALGSAPVPQLAAADVSLLVVRPCYLALRRAVGAGVRADGVVLVEEPGRSLDAVDVSRALGLPVVCSVETEPAVARAVDAGLLTSRLPRSFARSLQAIA
ncbi:MAG: hypothetical protein JST64_00570 [Actinobacteria bacterium]|nr:hypothetical protein [Actinomycetota bacterium]